MQRLGYGELEEEILAKFHPYKNVKEVEGVTAEQFWNTTPLHERIIDPVRLSKALDELAEAERLVNEEAQQKAKDEPKVTIKKADLDRFIEETGMRPTEAEEYFFLSKGDLEEALMIWVNKEPGKPPKPLCEYEDALTYRPILK